MWFKAWGLWGGWSRSVAADRKKKHLAKTAELYTCALLSCASCTNQWTLLATMYSLAFSKLCLHTHISQNHARTLDLFLEMYFCSTKFIARLSVRNHLAPYLVPILCETICATPVTVNIEPPIYFIFILRMCGSWRFFGHTSDIFATTHPHTKIMNIGLSFEKIHQKGA